MRSTIRIFALLLFALTAAAAPASAQLGGLKDKLKDKAKEAAKKKGEQSVKGTPSQRDTAAAGESGEAGEPADVPEGQAPAASSGGTAAAEDMTLYSKYDFVPGDKVIFFDDLSQEEMGEFPSRWGLEHGVFEVAKKAGQQWIWCSAQGMIYPKIPPGPFPEKYTIEMEFYANEKDDGWMDIRWLDAEDRDIGRVEMSYDTATNMYLKGERISEKRIPRLSVGKHTMRVMATKTSMKCYIDQERIANVPAVEGFNPVKLAVQVDPYFPDHDPMLIGAFRFAEGGKTLRQQLDETGKIVTHGILFDVNSDKIKAESFKTLADIGGLLTEDAALRLSIEGHTDADGADDANMDLSLRRAASVRTYISDTYKVDGSRLEAKGWGETKPIDANTSPEGRANNRRVELIKL